MSLPQKKRKKIKNIIIVFFKVRRAFFTSDKKRKLKKKKKKKDIKHDFIRSNIFINFIICLLLIFVLLKSAAQRTINCLHSN